MPRKDEVHNRKAMTVFLHDFLLSLGDKGEMYRYVPVSIPLQPTGQSQ